MHTYVCLCLWCEGETERDCVKDFVKFSGLGTSVGHAFNVVPEKDFEKFHELFPEEKERIFLDFAMNQEIRAEQLEEERMRKEND